MTIHCSARAPHRFSASGLRTLILTLAAAASLSAAGAQAQTVADPGATAPSGAQRDAADAPKPAPNSHLGNGLDPQTRDQVAQASEIQQRMANIARLPKGVSNWNDAMVLGGNFGQAAKFNLALRLHRWDIVGGMAAGYLFWFAIVMGVLALLGRLGRARPSH